MRKEEEEEEEGEMDKQAGRQAGRQTDRQIGEHRLTDCLLFSQEGKLSTQLSQLRK